MQLPDMNEAMERLKNPEKKADTDGDLANIKWDIDALFLSMMQHVLEKRNTRLARAKKLRKAYQMLGFNPFRRRHTIARVKRAQYKNAKKGQRVYKRSNHGGHF